MVFSPLAAGGIRFFSGNCSASQVQMPSASVSTVSSTFSAGTLPIGFTAR